MWEVGRRMKSAGAAWRGGRAGAGVWGSSRVRVPDQRLTARDGRGREGLGHCGLGARLGQDRAAKSGVSAPVSLRPLPVSRWLTLKILGSGGLLTLTG